MTPVVRLVPSARALVGSEVRRDDDGVAAYGFRYALGDDAARLHAIDVIGDREDQRKVVFDQDQSCIELLLHALDQGAERLGLALGDPGGRLVEAEHTWCHRKH